MKKLSIGKKVWFCLSILILGYFISMAAGYYLGLKTESKVMVASESLFPSAMQGSAALTAFKEQIKGYNDAILMGEESIFEVTQEKADEARSSLESIIKMDGIENDLKKEIETTIAALSDFTGSAQEYYRAISQEEVEMDDKKMGSLAAQTRSIQKNLEKYKTELSETLQTNLSRIVETSKDQRMMNISLFLGVVVVSVFFSWLIIKQAINRPVNNTVDMIQSIAEGEGDLTKRLEIFSHDEMGEVARWFNIFIENLQSIIREFSQNAKVLNGASHTLVEISGLMSDEAHGLSNKSHSVSSSSSGMSDTLNTVAAAMEETNANTSMVASAAEEMNITINDIARNTSEVKTISNEAVGQARDAYEKMTTLVDSVQSIDMVTETITDISEQINLLALNATIEAARAGDAGKGFAVVANEIKELALQTAESSADIKTQINAVQKTTDATVAEIDQITKVICTINENVDTVATAVEEQSATTKNIAENIAQASESIQQMNEQVNATSTSATQISETIIDVDQSGNAISENSEQVNFNAQELMKMADELTKIVRRFKIEEQDCAIPAPV